MCTCASLFLLFRVFFYFIGHGAEILYSDKSGIEFKHSMFIVFYGVRTLDFIDIFYYTINKSIIFNCLGVHHLSLNVKR